MCQGDIVDVVLPWGAPATGVVRSTRIAASTTSTAAPAPSRMQQAQQRLAAGASVTQVAADAGYLNPSKFSAAFQRITGRLPSNIR